MEPVDPVVLSRPVVIFGIWSPGLILMWPRSSHKKRLFSHHGGMVNDGHQTNIFLGGLINPLS